MADVLRHEDIDACRERESPDAKMLCKFRSYASGDHNRVLSAAQRKMLGSAAANAIADNVLRLVLTTAASRLELEGWEVPADPVQTFLDTFYLHARIGRLQFDTNFAFLRDGMSAVSLRWKPSATDTGRVTAHREQWWDGKYGVFVAFDDFDEPAWAVLDFVTYEGKKATDRRVVYYPDMICRYIKDGQGWKPYELPSDPPGSRGIIPWVKPDGTPIGLPVIAFANSLADEGNYGRSDLWGLLGLQDDLNSIQHDMTAAGKYTGFQMYYATGMTADETKGKVGPGQILTATDPAARIGAIPPGDMGKLIEAHTYKRQTIGVDTSTPMHLITGGEWPSGEALLRAEMPLVDKVKKLARVNGPSYVMLAHRATEIYNTFSKSGEPLDEDSPITARFSPPERLDELTTIAVQQAREKLYASLGSLSDPILLEKTGLLDKGEITKILAAKEEREAALLTPVGEF